MSIESCFETLLELAIQEDLGDSGDVTSLAVFSDETTTASLYSKDEGVLAGTVFFEKVYKRIDPDTSVIFEKLDGESLGKGDLVATVTGKVLSVLSAERISINFLGYLSGIATATSHYVRAADGRTVILDTRKTLPGYRALAKWAVIQGGGSNHRMGLYDMVMIKDNHIDAAGTLTCAVQKIRERWGQRFRIEVECRTIDEVREALECAVDIIMLDHMTPEQTRESTALRKEGVYFETSGDMTETKICEYRDLGIDYISVGRLTHSVSSFDFSLGIDKGGNR